MLQCGVFMVREIRNHESGYARFLSATSFIYSSCALKNVRVWSVGVVNIVFNDCAM
jgi:hypothetical protein